MTNNEFRDDRVAREAEQALYGEDYAWLRSRRMRRWLVVASALALIVVTATRFADWPLVTLLGLLMFMATWLGLRIAVRKIVDLPDAYIDERMRERRGEVYRQAYTTVGALLSVIMVAHIASQLLARYRGWPALSGDMWFDLAMSVIFAMLVLPNAIYAWNERDI